MISSKRRSPEAVRGAWDGLITRARLRAYDLASKASLIDRIEDVVPTDELMRRVDQLDELRPAVRKRRRAYSSRTGWRKLPGLRQLFGLREDLKAILEFCDAAASSFKELAQRVTELERRLGSSSGEQD